MNLSFKLIARLILPLASANALLNQLGPGNPSTTQLLTVFNKLSWVTTFDSSLT